MNEKQWLEQAEDYESRAQEALESGDESAAELWQAKAQACRHNAMYAPVEE
jgi:phage shock protein A